jgi:hypothetical protein
MRRLLIAKRIMAEMLAANPSALPKPSIGVPESKHSDSKVDEESVVAKQRRNREWRRVLRDPIKDASEYYSKAERQLIETYGTEELTRRLHAMGVSGSSLPHMKHILRTITDGLGVRTVSGVL